MVTPRRRRAWADAQFTITLVTATLMVPLDLLGDLPQMDVKTVTRIVGSITILPDNFTSTDDGANVIDVGIGVVSKEAFDAAVVPDPQTTTDYPTLGWLWKARLVAYRQNGSGTVEEFGYPRIDLDVRSQRKVDKGVLFITAFNASLFTGWTCIMVGNVRSLCLT